ncbi:hypothetical protein [Rhodococcus daqingensis]|uniref:Uncharacterized protein n=1 Tax=Rhodococcus daqingensis TaxID=2479363 RepID=A0ABW2RUE0_9NOCA
MPARYHVTSALNRASILRFGLDWRRMGAAPGIAGSRRPVQEGCFLAADEFERDWFVRMNNTGGAVDVWEVHGVDAADLVLSPEGYHYFPGVIPTGSVRLAQRDLPPASR